MWKTVAIIVTMAAVALANTATAPWSDVPQTSELPPTSEFARVLFTALGQSNISLVISPYSLVSLLIQIATYAQGETAAQILSPLGMQLNHLEQIVQGMHQLREALHESVAQGLVNYLDPTFMIANGTRFVVLQSIGQEGPFNVRDEAGAYTPEFVHDFVSDHTEGRVSIQVPSEALGVNTIVVVDAMIVQARWHDLFNRNQTSRHAFKSETPDGYVDTEVDMMTGVRTALWRRHDDLRVDMLQLPLRDPQLVFAIVLPHDTEGLPALERTLMGNGHLLEEISQGLVQTRVRVSIPKFRFGGTLFVKDGLEDLGIAYAFDPTRADFRNISDFENLYLYDVVHAVAVEVNEDGVAIRTPLESATPAALASPEQTLVVDHPFLFFIKHNGLGQVLMAGKYLGP